MGGGGGGGWLENSVSLNCNCFLHEHVHLKKKENQLCWEGFSDAGRSILPRLEKGRTVIIPALQPTQTTRQCNFPEIRGLRFQNVPLPLFFP